MPYIINFGGNSCATTKLETGDAPQAIAAGKIISSELVIDFDYLHSLSNDPDIIINEIDHNVKYINISTRTKISVHREDGLEIKNAIGINIEGMNDDYFLIVILGIDRPFFDEEFPHINKQYKQQFP